MLIRREVPADRGRVRAVHLAAFAGDDGEPVVEADLAEALRADQGWIPELSLVAAHDSGVVGHVIATRGVVETCDGGRPFAALGLGPLGVVPPMQGHGVGTALMHAVLAAAEARDETLVCLLGSPAYYRRFGFLPAVELGIAAPDPAWGGYFQARRFGDAPVPAGTFRYAAPFADLG